jgi:hypothetical protein
LAFFVFTWGYQYKISLYDPPQAISHQMPEAKLLSKDQRQSPIERVQAERTKAFVRAARTSATFVFLLSLLVPGPLKKQAPAQSILRTSRPMRLQCFAGRDTHFVRPPPALV